MESSLIRWFITVGLATIGITATVVNLWGKTESGVEAKPATSTAASAPALKP